MSGGRGQRRVRTGFLLLVVTGLIWGTIGIAARLVFDRTALDALELSWMRTLFAAPACFLIGLRLLGRRLFDVAARDMLWVAGLAISIFVFQFLYLIGVREIGVTVATLICLYSIPVLVATTSILLFGERLGALGAAGAGLLIAGLMVLTFSPRPAEMNAA